MNPATAQQLRLVKDTIGRPIYIDSIAAGMPPLLLGYPLVECEHMAGVGTNAFPVMFANLRRGYRIVDRQGTRVLRDPFSNKPMVGFYTTRRTAGAVVNSECNKLVKCAAS